MANRRIEMYEYRQVLHRMRCGDSNREISRSRLMGRRKARQVRSVARQEGWLDPEVSLPDEATLAEHFRRDKPRRSSISRVEPYRDEVTKWFGEGIDGTTIYAALKRKGRFQGSYSSVRRFLKGLRRRAPTHFYLGIIPTRYVTGHGFDNHFHVARGDASRRSDENFFSFDVVIGFDAGFFINDGVINPNRIRKQGVHFLRLLEAVFQLFKRPDFISHQAIGRLRAHGEIHAAFNHQNHVLGRGANGRNLNFMAGRGRGLRLLLPRPHRAS